MICMNIPPEEIIKNIESQLKWDDRIDASQIDVYFENGGAILKGIVSSFHSKQIALESAFSVKGVQNVKEELNIVYPENKRMVDDKQLQQDSEDNIHEKPSLGGVPDVRISVTDGIVKLKGTVDAFWKKIGLESMISSFFGVIDIINEIATVPGNNRSRNS